MDLFTLIPTALSLAMDAFAVSVGNGIAAKKYKLRFSLKMGLFFGGFQFGMTVIGYLLGAAFSGFIHNISAIVGFIVLGFIGGKMIFDAVKNTGEVGENLTFSSKLLTIQALATSIDAMAVGVTMAVMESSHGFKNLIISSSVIGVVAFVLAFFGGYLGRITGKWLGRYAALAGGIVLVGIGLKILIENL